MDFTFLGHQGWLVTEGKTSLLLDPLLLDTFGHCAHRAPGFFPRRVLDRSRMPRVDAVLLSHEHFDHFHLPSLATLDRQTPILCGPLMPSCVTDAIEKLGFQVTSAPLFDAVELGELELRLYPAG